MALGFLEDWFAEDRCYVAGLYKLGIRQGTSANTVFPEVRLLIHFDKVRLRFETR